MTGIEYLFYSFYNIVDFTCLDYKSDLLFREKDNLFVFFHCIFS